MGSLCGLEGNEEGTSSVLGVGLVEGAQGLTLRPQRPLQLIPSLRYAAPCNAVMPLPQPTRRDELRYRGAEAPGARAL